MRLSTVLVVFNNLLVVDILTYKSDGSTVEMTTHTYITDDNFYIVTVDKCSKAKQSRCHRDAFCLNTRRAYRCRCKPGFYGSGKICVGQFITGYKRQ